MQLEIVKPLAFVSAGGSAVAANASIDNLGNDRRGKVWRTTTATGTQHFIVDLGIATTIDRIALLRMNLQSTATWQVRAGTTAANTSLAPTFDSGIIPAWASTTLRRDKPNSYLALNHVERFWRFDLTDSGNPDGFLEAQRLVMAKAILPNSGASFGSGRGAIDFGEVSRSINGTPSVRQGRRFPKISLQLDWIDDAEYETFLAFLESVGRTQPFLIHAGADDPVDGMAKMYYGPIFQVQDIVYASFDVNRTQIEMTSWM